MEREGEEWRQSDEVTEREKERERGAELILISDQAVEWSVRLAGGHGGHKKMSLLCLNMASICSNMYTRTAYVTISVWPCHRHVTESIKVVERKEERKGRE